MNAHQPPAFNVEKRTDQLVRLRAEIDRLDKEHKDRMKPYKEMWEKLTGAMMAYLNDTNSQSVKTGAGTVFLSSRKTASLEDADAFMRYVVSNEAWDLLDRKANATAVADYIEEHDAPPPGVRFSVMETLNIRKAP